MSSIQGQLGRLKLPSPLDHASNFHQACSEQRDRGWLRRGCLLWRVTDENATYEDFSKRLSWNPEAPQARHGSGDLELACLGQCQGFLESSEHLLTLWFFHQVQRQPIKPLFDFPAALLSPVLTKISCKLVLRYAAGRVQQVNETTSNDNERSRDQVPVTTLATY